MQPGTLCEVDVDNVKVFRHYDKGYKEMSEEDREVSIGILRKGDLVFVTEVITYNYSRNEVYGLTKHGVGYVPCRGIKCI